MEMDDYIILDSTPDGKLSLYVISNEKICFENMHTVKEFIIYLHRKIGIDTYKEDFVWFYEDEKRFKFDKIPYCKD